MALNKKISVAFAFLLLTAIFTFFNWISLEYLALFPVTLLFVYLAIFQSEKFFLFEKLSQHPQKILGKVFHLRPKYSDLLYINDLS